MNILFVYSSNFFSEWSLRKYEDIVNLKITVTVAAGSQGCRNSSVGIDAIPGKTRGSGFEFQS